MELAYTGGVSTGAVSMLSGSKSLTNTLVCREYEDTSSSTFGYCEGIARSLQGDH